MYEIVVKYILDNSGEILRWCKKNNIITVIVIGFVLPVGCCVVYNWSNLWYVLGPTRYISARILERTHTGELLPLKDECKPVELGSKKYLHDANGEIEAPEKHIETIVNNICSDRYYMKKINELNGYIEFEAIRIPTSAQIASPKHEIIVNDIEELDFIVSLYGVNNKSVYVDNEDKLILEPKQSIPAVPFEIHTLTNTLHRSVPHIDIGLGPHTASVKYFYKSKKNAFRELNEHAYILKKQFVLDKNDKILDKDTQVTISANGYIYLRAKKSMERSVELLSNIDMHKEHRIELQYTPTLATPISFIRFGDIKISIQNIKDGMISVSTSDNCKVLLPQSGQYEMQTGPQVDMQTSVVVKIMPLEHDEGIQYNIRIQIATEGKGYVPYVFKIKKGTGHRQTNSNIYFGIKDSSNSNKFQELKFWDVFVY